MAMILVFGFILLFFVIEFWYLAYFIPKLENYLVFDFFCYLKL